MKKFFLFRRESEGAGSGATTSNTGVGISSLSIPADSMAYMTTKAGGLVITFNQSSAFESSFLNPGESIPKTTVEVGCAKGEEAALMESILNFISSDSKKSIMRFDAVNKNSTFSQFVQEKESVSPVIPTLAVETVSGEISQGTQEQQFQNSIAGINFQGNLPIVDYNHLGLAGFANTDTVTSWANFGTGGGTYNIAPGGGTTPSAVKAANQTNFSKDAVFIGLAEYFEVPALTVLDDYTIYAVIGTDNTAGGIGPLYGDADGETVGFTGSFKGDGAITGADQENKKFRVRHDGRLGAVASAPTSSLIIDDGVSPAQDYNPCSVFVIRRDNDFNMILHDETGDIVSIIDAVTGKSNTSGATDGNLLIERLGTTNEASTAFKGQTPRFGIIEKDIGSNAASTLATDLFNLYTL